MKRYLSLLHVASRGPEAAKAMDVCRQVIGRRGIFRAVDSDRFSPEDQGSLEAVSASCLLLAIGFSTVSRHGCTLALARSKPYTYGVNCLAVNGR